MAPDFRTTDHRASCWELLLLSVATISVSGEEKEESRGSWDHLARSWGGWWGAGVRRKGGGLQVGLPEGLPALCLLPLLLQREPTGATASRRRKGFGLRVGELCQLASQVSSAL